MASNAPTPPGGDSQDQIGFFRVAGLVRQLLLIIVPALTIQAIFLRYMIKDQVRDAVDAIRADMVSQKEFVVGQQNGDKIHAQLQATESELREQIHALELRIRTLELQAVRDESEATPRRR